GEGDSAVALLVRSENGREGDRVLAAGTGLLALPAHDDLVEGLRLLRIGRFRRRLLGARSAGRAGKRDPAAEGTEGAERGAKRRLPGVAGAGGGGRGSRVMGGRRGGDGSGRFPGSSDWQLGCRAPAGLPRSFRVACVGEALPNHSGATAPVLHRLPFSVREDPAGGTTIRSQRAVLPMGCAVKAPGITAVPGDPPPPGAYRPRP